MVCFLVRGRKDETVDSGFVYFIWMYFNAAFDACCRDKKISKLKVFFLE